MVRPDKWWVHQDSGVARCSPGNPRSALLADAAPPAVLEPRLRPGARPVTPAEILAGCGDLRWQMLDGGHIPDADGNCEGCTAVIGAPVAYPCRHPDSAVAIQAYRTVATGYRNGPCGPPDPGDPQVPLPASSTGLTCRSRGM